MADGLGTTLLNLRAEGLVGGRFRACYGESEVDSGFRFEHRAGLLHRSTTVLRGEDLYATWKRPPFGRWRLREASTPEWLGLRIRRRLFGATWIQRPDGVPVAAIHARRLGLTAELEIVEPTLPRWVALAALLSHLLAGS